MLSKERLFTSAVFIFAGLLGAPAAHAQPPVCFNLQSLQGAYAVLGNYGANVALALGTSSYDGNGNLTATLLVNEPTAGSTTGARTLVSVTQTGTYTVNCNGTGQINRITTANGVSTAQVVDFVITGAIVQPGQLVATTITTAQETPSAVVAGGVFLTGILTRLPVYNSY
jgi:hypothetical protein